MTARLFALALFFPAAAMALTAEPAPQPSKEKPVPAFGDDKPNCLAWTDGCIICKKQPDGGAACSTVGAACLPADPVCTKSTP